MIRILGDHQHEGLHDPLALFAGEDFQIDLGTLMHLNAVFQLQPLQFFFVVGVLL
ncbi:MAG: hypothetical protein JNK87_30875, partial [Bryobacterales bacterium]|nr:hypothetical protein [Bryobacterales bacterium]